MDKKGSEEILITEASEESADDKQVETFTKEELDGLEDIGGGNISAEEIGEEGMSVDEVGEVENSQRVTPDMEGPWYTVSEGVEEQGKLIQDAAQTRGWTGIVDKDPASEGFWNAVEEAEEWMNESVPDGFYFGTNDNGDWGMFVLEGDEEEVVKAPKLSEQQMQMSAADEEDKLTEEEEAELKKQLEAEEDDEFEKTEKASEKYPDGVSPAGNKLRGPKSEGVEGLNRRMPEVEERWAPENPAPDSPLGYFVIKITPPTGSPFKPKEVKFLMSGDEQAVKMAAEKKLADLTREWKGLEQGMSVEMEGPDTISDADVLDGDLNIDVADMDWARKHPGEAHASYGTEVSRSVGEKGGRGYDGGGERAISIGSSLQLKDGHLLWAADESIPQKPLPAGYRWVKVGDTYVQMKDDEAATLASIVALKHTSLASEFRDDLYPIKAQAIKEGDRVYVRPLMQFATVIGMDNGRYLVAAKRESRDITGGFYPCEVELR